jgi:peptidyl-prolyl cis-trans isomerase C
MTIQIDTRRAFPFPGLPILRASTLGLFAAALLAVAPIGLARAADDPVVARVQGVEIHESDLALAEEDMGQAAQQMTGDAKRDYVITYLADVILAAKAAEAKKIDSQPEFKGRMTFIRNKLLMETLLQDVGKAAVTDEEMKKVYEEATKQATNEQEVRARHILVPTEDEAKAILAEVKKGTDFA